MSTPGGDAKKLVSSAESLAARVMQLQEEALKHVDKMSVDDLKKLASTSIECAVRLAEKVKELAQQEESRARMLVQLKRTLPAPPPARADAKASAEDKAAKRGKPNADEPEAWKNLKVAHEAQEEEVQRLTGLRDAAQQVVNSLPQIAAKPEKQVRCVGWAVGRRS